ncbi:MAG: hypothetical protein K1Y02_25995 [Candidatus Hydrogenedentes bacterium]|nr:hypothetical protein [Candidatus Hydrogenedentota bacterium]
MNSIFNQNSVGFCMVVVPVATYLIGTLAYLIRQLYHDVGPVRATRILIVMAAVFAYFGVGLRMMMQ